jgi:TolB-like protein
MDSAPDNFYVTGGTLRYDAPCYVERQADRDLFANLIQGEYCYVLTSRQMGKSSLMVRTASRLRQQGIQVATWDLTAIGQNLTPEQWYDGLIVSLGRQLHLEAELDSFWLRQERLGPVQRLCLAIQEVALRQSPAKLIIFVDEIDAVTSLPFSTDEFFAAIRECYNRRSIILDCQRLAFCLLGVAMPADLIRNSLTPVANIGRRIELADFTPVEAAPLAAGLRRCTEPVTPNETPLANETAGNEQARRLLDRVLYWTNGHPHLTQRLCRAVAETTAAPVDESIIDRLCEELFLSARARERDDNLLFVRERVLRSGADLTHLLTLYEHIHRRQRVPDDEANPLNEILRLSGIVRMVKGCLQVRNRVYLRVFDRHWIKANLPNARRRATKSIAVLPFVNLTGDPANEYVSDGLTDDLITALSQIKELRVVARTSAFLFKGKPQDVRKIGAQLGVDHLLEGTLRRADGMLRITAQLIQVSDGGPIWSEQFHQEMANVFSALDGITRAIVGVLRVRLASDNSKSDIHLHPTTPEAYHLYLRGRYYWNQRGIGLAKGLHYFELALLEDPDFCLAYSGLADSYALLGFYGYLPNQEAFPKARQSAVRALEINESLAEPHTSLALVSFLYDWDYSTAEKEFKRAITLNPNYAPAHYWYASCLSAMERLDDALTEDRQAMEIDPLSVFARTQMGWMLFHSKQYALAILHLRQALELDPNFILAHWLLGQAYLFQSRHHEAIAALQTALHLAPHDLWFVTWLGYAYAITGRTTDAVQILTRLQTQSQHQYVRPFLFAILHAGLGHQDDTFHWLEKAREEREEWLAWLRVDATFDRQRQDPRFFDLLRRMRTESHPKTSPRL